METAMKNLMFDLASGREIYDEEQGRVMSKAEANDAIRKVCFEKLGLTKDSTDKQIRRALKSDKAFELFQVIEELVDLQISYGLSQDDFFNAFVETKNIADGDKNEFWVEGEDLILNVAKANGDHHDLSIQRLGEGQNYSVPVSSYAIKVGGDIRLFLTGRKDWSALVDAVARAYMNKIQTELKTEFVNGTNLLPVPSVLKGTGAINKAQFDAIIEKVCAANESSCIIMGTKTALKNLNALTIVDWSQPASSVKEAVANTGILGNYEGTPLLEIPQKFTDNTLATPIVPVNTLWIMPVVDNKPVKFVDYGETELEKSERGDYMDDMHTYEVHRTMGVATLMTRYFGKIA